MVTYHSLFVGNGKEGGAAWGLEIQMRMHMHIRMHMQEGGAAWGSEIQMRTNLERLLAKYYRVPIVQLVVQGARARALAPT